MDLEYSIKLMGFLMEGLTVSLKIFILTLIFAIPLGVIVAVLSMQKNKVIIGRKYKMQRLKLD